MNWKTTVVLAALLVAGGATWLVLALLGPDESASPTLAVLEKELTRDQLTRIEIKRPGGPVVLEKGAGGEWSLPGKWPVRPREVEQLLGTLTNLRSRFVPLPLGNPPDLKRYGLDRDPLVVLVKAGGKDHKLELGHSPEEANRFARATYLRLDGGHVVVRLAPGIVSVLDRPQEDYQQRRLFPAERVARETSPEEKEERLAARAVRVVHGKDGYALEKKGDEWVLRGMKTDPKAQGKFAPGPLRDRPDPDKLRGLQTAIPDLWVERFIAGGDKTPEDLGLKDPEGTVEVTRPGGDKVTLRIGKVSRRQTRIVPKQPPPFGGPPMKQPPMIVTEEFRYARLEGNEQLFEIKGDRLKDVLVAAEDLRDPQLARFRDDDVRRVEIHEGGRELILVRDKDKDRWRLEKPLAVEAERGQVTELLGKLSGLEARGPDVIDQGDPKKYGLDKPATIKLTLEEGGKGDKDAREKKDVKESKAAKAKEKKTRYVTFELGRDDKDSKKLYVRVEGWERINAVDDAVLKLVRRPALAYRSRRVLDFAAGDVSRIDVQRKADPFALEQVKNAWRLTAPVKAEADSGKAEQLAGELGRLEALEFVKADPTPEELEKEYGLAKPAETVKVSFSDAKKPAQVVTLGKQRPGKQDYFARLGSDPAVFAIKKDAQEVLARDSLSYRPLTLWELRGDDIAELRVRKEGPEYRLKRDGDSWKLSGPFEADVPAGAVRTMAQDLAKLRAEKYVAHTTKDLAKYGLEKPYLRVTLRTEPKKEPEDKDKKPEEKKGDEKAVKEGKEEKAKERVLLVGGPTEKGAKTRFAKLGDGEAVFVLAEKAVAPVDRTALDLLDRKLLTLDYAEIQRVRALRARGAGFTLQRDKDDWRVIDSAAPAFKPDKEALEDTLRALANLRAQRLAAYGPKADLSAFGLEEPALTLKVTVQGPGEKGKPGKTTEHTVALGKAVEGGKGERYARVDAGPAVAVLDAPAAEDLYRTHLDFVSRSLLRVEPEQITSLKRSTGAGTLELVKKGGAWRLVKPADQPADQELLEGLARDLAGLRAERVAAYPVKALKPFGLEKPAAVLTVRLGDSKGKPAEHVLQLGAPAPDRDGKKGSSKDSPRYARLDKSDTVVVLGPQLVKELLAPPLQFRDRTVARVPTPERVVVEHPGRKVTFTRVDDAWKMTAPVEAEAESADLDVLLKDLSRLRAGELVAEAPTDLKPYGLAPPRAIWRLFAGDKEVLALLVGGPEKGGPAEVKGKGPGRKAGRRFYAKLASGPLVFLLDPAVSELALAEHRSRKFWPRVDAAQVEKVTYRTAKGAFTLEKVGGDWEVAGKPKAKVNAEAVRDLLDALDGLRAERYVADAKADLKLYGLDGTALLLEVETPAGKRAVRVGRQEGESERRYANVPGSDAVFVIAEAAARRIVRPLEAFTAPKREGER
jgi:hypothetical protein